MSSMDLVEFLKARLDEDERIAQALNGESLRAYLEGGDDGWAIEGDTVEAIVGDRALAEHIARHDPARVLADVAAKRRLALEVADTVGGWDITLTGEFGGTETGLENLMLQLLALPYADHPDYQAEWKP